MPRKSGASVSLPAATDAPQTSGNQDLSAAEAPSYIEPKSHSKPQPGRSLNQMQVEIRTSKASEKKAERKSTGGASAAANGGINENGVATSSGGAVVKEHKEPKAKRDKDEMSIDDLLLPRTLMSRLARGSLPPNTSLQKDALLAITKSATVFISYLAHTANNLTSRKTIQAGDVLAAINEMEFDSIMKDRLEAEVKLFEEGVRGKRKGYRDRVKARESGVSQAGGEPDADGQAVGDRDDDDEEDDHADRHGGKRVKRSADEDVEMGDTSGPLTNPAPASATTSKKGKSTKISQHDMNDAAELDGDNDDDDDDPSAQLLAEARASSSRHTSSHLKKTKTLVAANDDDDQTDLDPDVDEDNDDEDEDDDENEDEDEDEDEGVVENEEDSDDDDGENDDGDEDEDEDESNRKHKGRPILAPDGRIEVDGGSDEESD